MLFYKSFAKKTLRRSGFTEPWQMIGIMLLFTIGAVTFPTERLVKLFYDADEHAMLLYNGIERLIFTAVMFHIVGSFGFKIIRPKTHIIALLAVAPALIIAVNNFPFVSFFTGKCSIADGPREIIFFAVWCIGVGCLEEVAYRGIILPLLYITRRNKKRPVLWTLVLSSAIFALSHLVNLISPSPNFGGVIMQVGYTFLIGAMCGIVMVRTGSIILPMILHVTYNFAGMLVEKCGDGIMWTTEQIICTAVVGVVVGVYLVCLAFTADRHPEVCNSLLGEEPTPQSSYQ